MRGVGPSSNAGSSSGPSGRAGRTAASGSGEPVIRSRSDDKLLSFQEMLDKARTRRQEDFSKNLLDGTAFSAKKFEDAHPELELSLHQDYKMPFGLSHEQFHDMIFCDLLLMRHDANTEEQKHHIYDIAQKIFKCVCSENSEAHYLVEAFERSNHNKIDILCGIASGFKPNDILQYLDRIEKIERKEVSAAQADTPLQRQCCALYEDIKFFPSDDTCKDIIAAYQRLARRFFEGVRK